MNDPEDTYRLAEPHSGPPPVPPVAPPQPYVPPYADASLITIRPYESARPRARGVVSLNWAAIVLGALLIWPQVLTLQSLQQMRAEVAAGVEVDYEIAGVLGTGLTVAEFVSLGLAVVYLLLIGVLFVFWMKWVHRTYRNLPALGADGLSYSPGWAVAYNFIPILSLFRPFQVMRETWKASHPSHSGGLTWSAVPVPALLGAWWTLYLASTIVSLLSVSLGIRTDNLDVLLALAWVDLMMLAVDTVLAYVEIRLVLQITNLQDERATAPAPALVATPYPAGWNAHYVPR